MAEQVGLRAPGEAKQRALDRPWRALLVLFTVAGLALAISQIFLLRPILENAYLYWLLAAFLPFTFLMLPATRMSPRNKVPWYDILLFTVTLGMSVYFALNAYDIIHGGWAFQAPLPISIVSAIFVLIVLEAVRRAGGMALFIFALLFAAYPLFASYMPAFLEAGYYPFWVVVRYHVLSTESLLGIPMSVSGTLLIGFMVFGVALVATGAGKFFLSFAFALFGTQRGGPAKVSVVASGLFGSLSGSVMSNVITTGCVTIPAMKRVGYAGHYAGAVEACASTGGCIMPPVMGAVGFVMASFLAVPYLNVAAAAALPAILYYWALYWQVDAHAGRLSIKGLHKSEVPAVLPTLRQGWPYIVSFAVLLLFLFLRREAQSPFFATAVMLAIAMMRKDTRLSLKSFFGLGESTGRIMAEIIAILAACGFILGGFSLTGVGSSFAREVIEIGRGIPFFTLLLGAVACYILGMGMTITACYVFLVIVLAPGLIAQGFNVMAVHMFILYWGLSSFITPPVALGSYAAASLAGASPMKVGYTSMRLGIVLYYVPFIFVFSPALVLQGPLTDIALVFLASAFAVFLLATGLEGYAIGIGKIETPLRLLAIASGLLIGIPGWEARGVGLAAGATCLAAGAVRRWLAARARAT